MFHLFLPVRVWITEDLHTIAAAISHQLLSVPSDLVYFVSTLKVVTFLVCHTSAAIFVIATFLIFIFRVVIVAALNIWICVWLPAIIVVAALANLVFFKKWRFTAVLKNWERARVVRLRHHVWWGVMATLMVHIKFDTSIFFLLSQSSYSSMV